MTAQIAAYGRLVGDPLVKQSSKGTPEPPTENYADLRNAVNRTYADMGTEQISRVGISEPHHAAGAIRLFLRHLKRYGALLAFRHGPA